MRVIKYALDILELPKRKEKLINLRGSLFSKVIEGEKRNYTYNIGPLGEKDKIRVKGKDFYIYIAEERKDSMVLYGLDENGDLYRIKIPMDLLNKVRDILGGIQEKVMMYNEDIRLDMISEIVLDPMSDERFKKLFRKAIEELKKLPEPYIRKAFREKSMEDVLYWGIKKEEAGEFARERRRFRELFKDVLLNYLVNFTLNVGKDEKEEAYKVIGETLEKYKEIIPEISERVTVEKICEKNKNKIVIIGLKEEPTIVDLTKEKVSIKAETPGITEEVFIYHNGEILNAVYDSVGIPRKIISLKTGKKVM